ncbi:winged helix-turn-helix domain-containing protein, partial [Streptomyces tendae]|uniref:helix-turn-helix domain-containing protein n=1 Tax=Streptomyces tendae TaxID=1932 RepID=UPI0036CC83B0
MAHASPGSDGDGKHDRPANSRIPRLPRHEDQRWTLSRVKTVIGRHFDLACTVQGARKLLVRNGWSCQVPARRAVEPGSFCSTLRSCLQMSRPHQERGEGDGCLVGLGGLVVAGR